MIGLVERLIRKGQTMKPTATWPKLCCGEHTKALGKRKFECRRCGTVHDLEKGRVWKS